MFGPVFHCFIRLFLLIDCQFFIPLTVSIVQDYYLSIYQVTC